MLGDEVLLRWRRLMDMVGCCVNMWCVLTSLLFRTMVDVVNYASPRDG